MDRVRYVLAVIGLVSIPPAVLYWFIIHPFVDVWRRVGKPTTYTMLFVVFVACGYALWLARGPLLAVDYGTNPWLWTPGLAFYLGAVAIQTKIRRQLTFKVLAGVPELDCSANTLGKRSSFAAAMGICPAQRVQPFKAPKQEMMAPMPIR